MAKRKKPIRVRYVDKVGGTEVFRAYYRAMPEMIDIGAASGEWAHIDATDSAFYIAEKGKVVAFIIYVGDANEGEARVHFGYVHPDYRKRGYYNLVWKALVKACKSANYDRIYATILEGNEVMEAVAKQQGRVRTSSTWKLEL
jgi:RimJ/RimL family protein N-acetyltransferase